jgi:hypothetical protein
MPANSSGTTGAADRGTTADMNTDTRPPRADRN